MLFRSHIDSTAAVRAGVGVPAIAAGKGADFTLNQGDVLQLMIAPMTDSTPMTCGAQMPNLAKFCKANSGFDLTGSKITASAPVQVIGGHDCTNVPFDVQACDHVEETLFPLNTWGKSVLVAPAQSVTGAKSANGLPDQQLLRVISEIGRAHV